MKVLKRILFVVILTIAQFGYSQINNMPQRTPEQEAIKQTEKLQQAVQLSPEQVKSAYEINLKYARERQISNNRSEAVERLKNKNNEINRILNAEQSEQLQSKRYQRSTFKMSNPAGSGVPVSGYQSAAPSYRPSTPTDRSSQSRGSSTNIQVESGSRVSTQEIRATPQPSRIRTTRPSAPSSTQQNRIVNRSYNGASTAPRKYEPVRSTQSTQSVPNTSPASQSTTPQERSNSTTNSGRR